MAASLLRRYTAECLSSHCLASMSVWLILPRLLWKPVIEVVHDGLYRYRLRLSLATIAVTLSSPLGFTTDGFYRRL